MLHGYKKGCYATTSEIEPVEERSLPVVLDLVAFVQKHDVPIDGDE